MVRRSLVALLVAVLALVPSMSRAQDAPILVTLTGGWQYGGTQPYISGLGLGGGTVHANAGANFGAMVTVPLPQHYDLALAYTYQPGEIVVRPEIGRAHV